MIDGQPVRLPAKAFDTLLALVDHSGEVLTKDELIKAVWPDTFVEEINLTVNISALRKLLGEAPNDHRYIVTLPRRGYSFVAPVERLVDPTDAEPVQQPAKPLAPEPAASSSRGLYNGPIRLKWVAAGLAMVLGAALLAFYPVTWGSKTSQERQRSLAVLPFKVLSADADEFVGAGMADAIITRLGSLRQIAVRPTGAVLKYDAADQDPLAAGRDLAVDMLLEGKIQNSNGRMRVTVQLIRVDDGATVWGYTFDEPHSSLFDVQDSISTRVAEIMELNLTTEESKLLSKRLTSNPEAQRLYTKGQSLLMLRTYHGYQKGIEFLERAIRTDPEYAQAYAALAEAHALSGYYDMKPPIEAYRKATEAAQKALQLDPTLADAYVMIGMIKTFFEWDLAGAEEAFKTAIDLSPNHSTAHAKYATCLNAAGRTSEALEELDRARRNATSSIVLSIMRGDILRVARRYDEALRQYREAVEMDPNYMAAYALLSDFYQQIGAYDEAVEANEKRMLLAGEAPELIEGLRKAYKQTGIQGYTRKVVELIETGRYGTGYSRRILTRTLIRMGEKEKAIDILEKLYAERQSTMIYLNVDPVYDHLRSHPRFQDLVRRVGFGVRDN
jgi:DNA-binding winged helix-turn-helix (wHTH) protein/tetratricopeptide (TPR) repeat protein